ncbi:MAG: RNase P subunit p30 family protein [Candidatus Hermodarchaeota archaeon]
MSYFESRLRVDFNDFNDIINKLQLCEDLGIKNLIIEPENKISIIPLDIKENIKRETNLKIFYRINLRLDDLDDFKRRIKVFNNFSDILSIESLNKDVQLHAARDSRVDIVSYSNPEIIKTLNPGVISLTKQNNSFLEFSLAPIMVNNKIDQSKNFRNLYKTIQLAIKLKGNIIISGNFDDMYDFRHPRALISICHSLLGIPLEKAKKIFKNNPILLLERPKKRADNNVELEFRIIKGGDYQ